MTNRIIGGTGLSVLVTQQPGIKKTAQEVAKWVATLPMADIGVAAKKLFLMLNDISSEPLTAEERYAVMENLRSPNRTICTALKRHYIEQRAPLTENKLIIANLRQTLLQAMADNYKLILEELNGRSTLQDADKLLMATSIVRIYYYLNVLLIARYQLYTFPQENVWHEIYLLYKYAKSRSLVEMNVPCQFAPSNQTSILKAFMRIILMYATDPYQWRQREQHSLNKAIEMWALYPTIYAANQVPSKKAGIYIIDLDSDAPPNPASFRESPLTASCIAVDLEKSVQHLQETLDKMRKDHLQAKIENPNDPEFSVTAPTIAKLINIWSQHIKRTSPRFPIQAQINIVFGLNAAHYYINKEKEFNPNPNNLRTSFDESGTPARALTSGLNLQMYEVVEEEEEIPEIPKEKDEKLSSVVATETKNPEIAEEEKLDEGVSKEILYHIYNYNIENINPHGFCIVIHDKSYPPFQAGEIVAFKNIYEHSSEWGIGAVRWLRRLKNEDFQIGIQIIAPFAKAAGIQMLRADKPTSRLSRCLILPEDKETNSLPMLVTTAFPIHSNNVMLYSEQNEPVKATLTKEVDASGMYYQYVYSTETGIDMLTAKADAPKKAIVATPAVEEEKTDTEFDKIWKDL